MEKIDENNYRNIQRYILFICSVSNVVKNILVNRKLSPIFRNHTSVLGTKGKLEIDPVGT